MLRPASPTAPFEFPFSLDKGQISPFPTDAFDAPRLPMDRVTRVVCLPRVFGLKGDSVAYARSMMDGGANICVTGILGLLVDVITIPTLPISVATTTHEFSVDACCTKKGLLPLTLTDGSTYYQECYYCKNAT